jgi:hypothetical protein
VLSPRIAVHSGAAEQRDGDYFGPTLNRAVQLRAVASFANTPDLIDSMMHKYSTHVYPIHSLVPRRRSSRSQIGLVLAFPHAHRWSTEREPA